MCLAWKCIAYLSPNHVCQYRISFKYCWDHQHFLWIYGPKKLGVQGLTLYKNYVGRKENAYLKNAKSCQRSVVARFMSLLTFRLPKLEYKHGVAIPDLQYVYEQFLLIFPFLFWPRKTLETLFYCSKDCSCEIVCTSLNH